MRGGSTSGKGHSSGLFGFDGLLRGEISNLSFGFRGISNIRESIHAVFRHHAILDAGMDDTIAKFRRIALVLRAYRLYWFLYRSVTLTYH